MSVLLVGFYLSNDLTVSVLLIVGVSIFLLSACDFSDLLTVSIFFFSEIGGVMVCSTTLGFYLPSLSTMSVFPSLTTVSVVVTNYCLASSKSPLVFLTLSIGVTDSLGNGQIVLDEMISVLYLLHPVNSRISA